MATAIDNIKAVVVNGLLPLIPAGFGAFLLMENSPLQSIGSWVLPSWLGWPFIGVSLAYWGYLVIDSLTQGSAARKARKQRERNNR